MRSVRGGAWWFTKGSEDENVCTGTINGDDDPISLGKIPAKYAFRLVEEHEDGKIFRFCFDIRQLVVAVLEKRENPFNRHPISDENFIKIQEKARSVVPWYERWLNSIDKPTRNAILSGVVGYALSGRPLFGLLAAYAVYMDTDYDIRRRRDAAFARGA